MGLSLLIKVHNITLLDSKNHGPDRDIHFMTCDNFRLPPKLSCHVLPAINLLSSFTVRENYLITFPVIIFPLF